MKKILVGEDDKFLANTYRIKLKDAGFEAKVVGDGEQVIEALNSFKPDLILLDLIMPKKDGFAALAEIKSKPEFKNIPVIVSSNLGQAEDIKKAQALGAKDYFIKTEIQLSEIVQKINHYLGS